MCYANAPESYVTVRGLSCCMLNLGVQKVSTGLEGVNHRSSRLRNYSTDLCDENMLLAILSLFVDCR
jgi:hypothetical protein